MAGKIYNFKNSCFILVMIFFAVSPLLAQNFEPGYIITSENDTLRGSIKDETDANLSSKIFFKNEEGIVKKYGPGDLLGFGFSNGRTFEKQAITSLTPEGTDSIFVFAKNLIRGKIDLFVLRFPHRFKPDIFLSNNSTNKTVHLSKPEKREIIGKDGKKYTGMDYRYAGNLGLIKGKKTTTDNKKPPRFSEKKIMKDILNYNEDFQQEYPLKVYEEEVKYHYDLLVGLPIQSADGLRFRAGIYRNKSKVERTRNFNFMQGVVYNHWRNEAKALPEFENGTSIFGLQLLNFIPMGLNYHGDSKNVQPYGYAGVGFAVGMLTGHVVENNIYTGTKNTYTFLPTLNLGMGLRVRVGKTYLITEFTPTLNGAFLSLGISI